MSHETRDKIIMAASELFYARSYADVGVQAICNHAGVKKGSFYHFFASKSELAIAVIADINKEFQTHILKPSFAPDIAPLQRFYKMVAMIQTQHRDVKAEGDYVLGCPFGNLAIELSTRDDAIRQKLDNIFITMKQTFKQALAEAQQNGDLPIDKDIDASADALVVFFEGVALLSKTRNDPDLIQKLSPVIGNFFI